MAIPAAVLVAIPTSAIQRDEITQMNSTDFTLRSFANVTRKGMLRQAISSGGLHVQRTCAFLTGATHIVGILPAAVYDP